jgi:type II secretory ATPase GspE/PulE/Tfp pilus assembly ATPase PilB-like protein
MEMDTTLREMTFRRERPCGFSDYARTAGGMTTLFSDGIKKVLGGQTTIDELLRVTASA